ncbi:Hypothetical Protein FCC1311_072232 [Hondaea fermentalgiana]|uniref:Uncharacterized protein n=1 Tax=Hondaea fermentalgiana TaxID=2315210 RepID=A0A2R5GJD9_9STRA|nr:Hypothetical Protein FCC1311_072232 [Hondaea fermentalgiana]|eukprot:GBG31002.1 Hypothetical Protein FCC1311_072232 [Hondaea fermentalgiana]
MVEQHTQQEALGVRVEIFVLQPHFVPLGQSSRNVGTPASLSIANKKDGQDDLRVSPGIEGALATFVIPENRANSGNPVKLGTATHANAPLEDIQEGISNASRDTDRSLSSEDESDDDLFSEDSCRSSDSGSEDDDDVGLLPSRLRAKSEERTLFQDATGKLTFRSLPSGFVADVTGALRFHSPESLKRALLVQSNLHRDVPAAAAIAASGKPTRATPSFRSIDRLVKQTSLCWLQTNPDGETYLLNLDSPAAMLDMLDHWLKGWPDRVKRKLQHHVDVVAPLVASQLKGPRKARALHSLWELALQPENHATLMQDSHNIISHALSVVDGLIPFCGHGTSELLQSVHYTASGLCAALVAYPDTRRALLARPDLGARLVRSFFVSLKRLPAPQLVAVNPPPALVLTIKALAHLSHETELHKPLIAFHAYTDLILNMTASTGDHAIAGRGLALLARALASSTQFEQHLRLAQLLVTQGFARDRRIPLAVREIIARSVFLFFRTARDPAVTCNIAFWDPLVHAVHASLTAFSRASMSDISNDHVNMTSWHARRAKSLHGANPSQSDQESHSNENNKTKRDADTAMEDTSMCFSLLSSSVAMLAATLENLLAPRHANLPEETARQILHSFQRVLVVIENFKENKSPSGAATKALKASDQGPQHLEVLTLATLVHLFAGRCAVFPRIVISHADEVWDSITIASIFQKRSRTAQILHARLLYMLAHHATVPRHLADAIYANVFFLPKQDASARRHPLPTPARRYLAVVWALACRASAMSLTEYLKATRDVIEKQEPCCRDAVIEDAIFGAMPLLVHATGGLQGQSLRDPNLDTCLNLLVDHGAKRVTTVTPLLRGLQRLLHGALDALARDPAPFKAEPVPAIDRCVRICVNLIERGSNASMRTQDLSEMTAEDHMIEAALHVLWIVASSTSPLAQSKSLSHMRTVCMVHAAVQSENLAHRNIARNSGRVLLALATRNPETVIEPLAQTIAQTPQQNVAADPPSIEIKAAHASKILLQSTTPELISCGAYLLSTYRLSADQHQVLRDAGSLRSLIRLVVDEDNQIDDTSRCLALVSLSRITAHDRANQRAVASPKLLTALENILRYQDKSTKPRRSFPPRLSNSEKVKASYDAWLDDFEATSNPGRLSAKPRKKSGRRPRPVPLRTQDLCKPMSSLWHSASEPSLRADPWSPTHFEAAQTPLGLSISINFDKFLFRDLTAGPPTSPEQPSNHLPDESTLNHIGAEARFHEQHEETSHGEPEDPSSQLPATSSYTTQMAAAERHTDASRIHVRNLVKRQMLSNFKGKDDSDDSDDSEASVLDEEVSAASPQRVRKHFTECANAEVKSHLAIFAHVEGGRVYRDLPLYELADGSKSHVYYQTSHEATDDLVVVMVPPPPAHGAPDVLEELPQPLHKPISPILQTSFVYFEELAHQHAAQDRLCDSHVILPPTFSLALTRDGTHKESGISWTSEGALLDDALPLLLALPLQGGDSRRSSSFLGLVSGRCERLGTFAYRQLPSTPPSEASDKKSFELASSVFADPSVPKSNQNLPACRSVLCDKAQFARLLSRDVNLSPDCAANIWSSIEKRFDLIVGIFSHYGCVVGNSNQAFTMQLNQFTLFLRDSGFLRGRAEAHSSSLQNGTPALSPPQKAEVESLQCNVSDEVIDIFPMDTSASDTLFIIVNKTLPETQLESLQNMLKGSKVFQVKRDEVLLLYEFIDSLVRVADITVCQPSAAKKQKDAHRIPLDTAVEAVLQRIVDLYMHERILLFDIFRVDRMHNWAVNSVLNENLSMFRKLFNRYTCVCGELSIGFGAARGQRLGLVDWHTLVDDLGLFSPIFTKRDASWIFVSATAQHVDPFKNWTKNVALSFPKFLEAMCRLADAIFIPTDEQYKSVGVTRDNGSNGFDDSDFDLSPSGIVCFYRLMQQTTLWSSFERPSYVKNACHFIGPPPSVEPDRSSVDAPAFGHEQDPEEHQQDQGHSAEEESEESEEGQAISDQTNVPQFGAESDTAKDEQNANEVENEDGDGLEPNEDKSKAPEDTKTTSDRAFYDERALDFKLVQLIKIVLATEVRRSSKVATRTVWLKFAKRADLGEKRVFKKLIADFDIVDILDQDADRPTSAGSLPPVSEVVAGTEPHNNGGQNIVKMQGVGRRLTLDIRVAQDLAASHLPRSAGKGQEQSECKDDLDEDEIESAKSEALASLPAPIKRDLLITAHQACEMVRSAAAGRSKDDLSLRETLFSKDFVEASSRRLVQLRAKRIPETKKFNALTSVQQQSYMAIVQRAVREFLSSPLE